MKIQLYSPENQIPVAKFRRLVNLARTELEVRRLMLWHQCHLAGTPEETSAAVNFAEARALAFCWSEEGVPVVAHGLEVAA